MKKIFLIFSVILVVTSNLAAMDGKAVNLTKGQSTTINTEYDIGDVAIADNTICDYVVQDSRRQVYLNPRGEGRTTLTIWDANGVERERITINIASTNLKLIMDDANKIFGNNSRINYYVKDNFLVIQGEVAADEDFEMARAFASKYPQVLNQVKIAPQVIDTIASQIEEAIATPGIKVKRIRNQIVLEGLVYNKDAYKKAESIARIYDPNILNLLEIKESDRRPGLEKTIKLDVYFVELKKSAIKDYGVSWSPGAAPASEANTGSMGSGGGIFSDLGKSATSMVGLVFNLLPKLKFTQEKGEARVLENPSMVVKNAEAAHFFSGSQVPYKTTDEIKFKDIGITIDTEPIIYGTDVDLKIGIEVSSMSPAVAEAIDTNNLKTTIYTKAGESVVLGSIFRNNDIKFYNKPPKGLDTSSALFSLALSKDFQSNKSEFYIFVTPTIVDSMPTAAAQLKEWFKLNDEITKDRSKKEFGEELAKRGEAPIVKIKKQKKKRNRK